MKFFNFFIILIITLCIPNKIYAQETNTQEKLKLYAKSACLYDADANRYLYSKDCNTRMPMASTTKIMTCITALEYACLDSVVTISPYAASMPDVQLNIKAGEQYTLNDLLYSLMLESHNDSAVAIAEYIASKDSAQDEVTKRDITTSKQLVLNFADLMNKKAAELGCENTHFVTPNGLDDDAHYTTALELCMIADYAISNEKFISITNTSSYTFSELANKRNFTVNNKNAFLHMYPGAIGCKTGFTGNAGYCFVGAIKTSGGKTLISSVLASGWPPNKTYKWADTKLLMNYGVQNYTLKQVLNYNSFKLPSVYVNDGIDYKNVSLYIDKNLSLLLNDYEEVDLKYELPSKLSAPVLPNCVIGRLSIYINDSLYIQYPIFTSHSVEKISYTYFFKKVIKYFITNHK